MPTTVMTNSPAMAVTLNKRCLGKHVHQQLIDGSSSGKTQEYLPQLCQALADGMVLQMQWDNNDKFLIATIDKEILNFNHGDVEMAVPPEEEDEQQLWVEAWDDITGESLDANKVREARHLEILKLNA